MFGWKLIETLSVLGSMGFLIFLAWRTRPGSTLVSKEGRTLDEKTVRRLHVVCVFTLIAGFVCFVAAVACYLTLGQ